MKFKFYICDTNEGIVRGTNDEPMAREFAESEDYFVIDSDAGLWLGFDGDDSIKPIK